MLKFIKNMLGKILPKKKVVSSNRKRTLTKKEVDKIKRKSLKFKRNMIRGFKKSRKTIGDHLGQTVNKFLYLLLLGGFAFFMLLLRVAPDYSNIGLIVFITGVDLGILKAWDVFFLPKLDTQIEIKNRNIAHGLLFLSGALIVSAVTLAVLG